MRRLRDRQTHRNCCHFRLPSFIVPPRMPSPETLQASEGAWGLHDPLAREARDRCRVRAWGCSAIIRCVGESVNLDPRCKPCGMIGRCGADSRFYFSWSPRRSAGADSHSDRAGRSKHRISFCGASSRFMSSAASSLSGLIRSRGDPRRIASRILLRAFLCVTEFLRTTGGRDAG